MLYSIIESQRRAKSLLLKGCRELFGIRFSLLQQESGLSTETLYRMERGTDPWTIDSEITYLTTINKLIDKKLTDDPTLKLPGRPDILKPYQHYKA